jgi:hypothetical protein
MEMLDIRGSSEHQLHLLQLLFPRIMQHCFCNMHYLAKSKWHKLEKEEENVGGIDLEQKETGGGGTDSPELKLIIFSTTGMIRHLRSCHHAEFVILQHAHTLKVLKNGKND